MKVYLQSLASGCTSSLHEISQYRQNLNQLGYQVTSNLDEADAIILNTCGFSTDAENVSLSEIDKIKKLYPQKKVIVGGCLSKINPLLLGKHHQGPSFLPEKMDEILQGLGDSRTHLSLLKTDEVQHLHEEDLKILNIKFKIFYFVERYFYSWIKKFHLTNEYLDHYFKSIAINNRSVIILAARGCLGACTYCSIKKSRGTLNSTPWKIIRNEIQKAVSENKLDLILRAEDLGAWGQDIDSNVIVLLRNIINEFPQVTITIPFFEPSWVMTYKDELIELLSHKQFICFYSPLHSASENVLKKMGRQYSSLEVIKVIREIKKKNPSLILKTNILHSFPTESWGDFFSSLGLGHSFDFTLPIAFTPRPGTQAYHFPTNISLRERKFRQLVAAFYLWPLNLVKLISNFVSFPFKKKPLA